LTDKNYAFEYITVSQQRAARAVLRWSIKRLADASGVPSIMLMRIELHHKIPEEYRISALLKIRSCLEGNGIEFIFHGKFSGIIDKR
jgi:hypothetical protein